MTAARMVIKEWRRLYNRILRHSRLGLMALAIHLDRLIREGAVESYSEIARLTAVCPAWITAVMKLADLPVPEQEGILSNRPPLTPACRLPATP